MSIAITEDHRALAETASEFLTKRDARGAARALLESAEETTAGVLRLVAGLVDLGWLGLHVPEEYGGSGYGLAGARHRGRGARPGDRAGAVRADGHRVARSRRGRRDESKQARLLPGLADGSAIGAVALEGAVTRECRSRLRAAGAVLGGGLADVLVSCRAATTSRSSSAGDGVTVEVPPNLDPTRRAGQRHARQRARRRAGRGRPARWSTWRGIDPVGRSGRRRPRVHRRWPRRTPRSALQFGRPIATYQAVKHHCANMLVATELATAAVWDAARAARPAATS